MSAWPGIEIVGSEFRYTAQRPGWLSDEALFPHIKIVMHVTFDGEHAVFQCNAGGPTTLLIGLDEAADRDIVAWVHEQVTGILTANLSEDPNPVPRPNPR